MFRNLEGERKEGGKKKLGLYSTDHCPIVSYGNN